MADSDSDEVEVVYVETQSHYTDAAPVSTAPGSVASSAPPGSTPDGAAPADSTAGGHTHVPHTQLATLESVANLQTQFAERIQGSRRENDDSGIAYGDKFSERFGGIRTMPVPSAPPMTPEFEQELTAWTLATTAERKQMRNHSELTKFFATNGLEQRTFDPYMSDEDLPVDDFSAKFKQEIADARARLHEERLHAMGEAGRGGGGAGGQPFGFVDVDGAGATAAAGQEGAKRHAISAVGPALQSLIQGTPPPKDFGSYADIYLPAELLSQHGESQARAREALIDNDQFDQVQAMVQESAQRLKANWVFGEKVSGGTLEVRMNAEGTTMNILGEGYKQRNMAPGIVTVATGIPKDTEYYHVPNKFTMIRINPGHLGLCQRTGEARQVMRLLPGRYALNERVVRFIGTSKIVPCFNVAFTPHEKSADPDIMRLARRFSAYYLPVGHRLFVSNAEGVFALDPDRAKRPFIFDSKAMEEPLNTENPRDFRQASIDERYVIVRLRSGQRAIARDDRGNECVLEYDSEVAEHNTYHFSKTFFDFIGLYSRDEKIVPCETMTSVRLSPNDVLVLKDMRGNVRFLNKFNPERSLMLRLPWQAIEAIPKSRNEYVYEDDDLKVARVKPGSNQWPIVYDTDAGDIRILPHSLQYVFSSAEQQIYVGMANRNVKEAQNYDVTGVGKVTIAVVSSGQLAMCRLRNMSFFLSPSPDPYVFRPPNEFLGMVDMEETHVHIPGSDLHRIYIPAGEWAVAMVDGRQVILDPARDAKEAAAEKEGGDTGSQGNGIWIFRAQQLQLEGPKRIDARRTELFNVVRLQVEMNEIAFGVDSTTGARLMWGPGNHTINKNSGQVFQGFFNTQLEDVKIEKFNVVWKGGVRSTVNISVGFHIHNDNSDGDEASEGMAETKTMRQVLGLCQNHEDLHAKVVENTKHQLFDVISQIEPLGYGNSFSDMTMAEEQDFKAKQTTLQDLEKMFSEHVDGIMKKYGIVVDNVTITQIDLDPAFIKRAEDVQNARMDARQKVLVAEQEMQRNQIMQQQGLMEQQARTRQEEETSKQREIERKREIEDVAAKAEANARAEANTLQVECEAALRRQEAEMLSQVKQEELKIKQLEQQTKSQSLEMEMRKAAAILEAETKAVEQTATAKAEAAARKEVAESMLAATKFEVEAQKLKAEGDRATGLAKMAVSLNEQYGGIEADSALLLELMKMKAAVQGQQAIAEATARCTDPAIATMMGRLGAMEELVPAMQQQNLAGLYAMPQMGGPRAPMYGAYPQAAPRAAHAASAAVGAQAQAPHLGAEHTR